MSATGITPNNKFLIFIIYINGVHLDNPLAELIKHYITIETIDNEEVPLQGTFL